MTTIRRVWPLRLSKAARLKTGFSLLCALILAAALVTNMDLPAAGQIFPFIWIPNSGEGTISKLDVRTGKELGRYRTGPGDLSGKLSPSRTTVDREGDVWVANRAFGLQGSAVKVGLLEANQCVDRNRNGIIETSKDLNGNGLIDSDEFLPWPAGAPIGQDECILLSVQLGGVDDVPRAVAIDRNNDAWIGLFNGKRYIKLDGKTGAIMQQIDVSPFTPYGAVVDPEGFLWSATQSGNSLLKIDPTTGRFETFDLPHFSYGISPDWLGNIWVTGWVAGKVSKVRRSDGVILATCSVPRGDRSRGVVVTSDNDVWVANSGSDTVGRLKNDCTPVATIPVGDAPTGVAVDTLGKVWTTNLNSNDASRIDPATNTVDGTFPVGLGPYSYSDMTGYVLTITTDGLARADLSLLKSDSPDPVNASGTLTYTLKVSNAGPGAASSVLVIDTLPAEMSFVSASGSGWSCNESGGVVSCSRPSLPMGDAPPITITVTAPASNGTLINSARVSSTTTDPDTTNNSADEETTVAVKPTERCPTADAGPDRTVKEGEIVRFRALGAPGNFSPAGLPLFFFWDFGDGSKAKRGKKVSHVYADNGSFTVTLTVTDGRDCVVQDTAEITVENVAPNAKSDGPILRARVGQPVHFFGRFGDPGKADTHTVEWDFGDGTIETFELPADPWLISPLTATHIYEAAGVYKVTLTVTDDDGDSDSVNFEARVFSNEARWLVYEHGFGFISFSVEGPGIESIELEVWDLSGRRVFKSDEVLGNTFVWPLQDDNGQALANGVYLYVIRVRDFDGAVIRGEVRKLVILR